MLSRCTSTGPQGQWPVIRVCGCGWVGGWVGDTTEPRCVPRRLGIAELPLCIKIHQRQSPTTPVTLNKSQAAPRRRTDLYSNKSRAVSALSHTSRHRQQTSGTERSPNASRQSVGSATTTRKVAGRRCQSQRSPQQPQTNGQKVKESHGESQKIAERRGGWGP